MTSPNKTVRSMLDVEDISSTSNLQHQDNAYQQQQIKSQQPTRTTQERKPLPQLPANNPTSHVLSSSTYAQFQPEAFPTGSGQHRETQVGHNEVSDHYAMTHTSGNEVSAKPSQTHADYSDKNAKDALMPIAGVPNHDNTATASGGQSLKERADAIAASATERTSATASSAVGQMHITAANTAANISLLAKDTAHKVNASVNDTTETAKLKVLSNPSVQDTSQRLREEFAADSHELAHKDYGIRGAVQRRDGIPLNGVRDIGWHRPTLEIPDPLIGGLPNGRLFSMIRRFNKDVFDVRAVPRNVTRGLDLNDAWSEKHASDKMTLHLQRMYLSVILGFASLGKQIARLRSWKETRRTGAFCAVYFTAWALDLLMPLILGTLIALVSSKEARDTLFPPAPLALVDIGTGGIQKPQAGQLGTNNTLTGAPEKQEGEAVEEEAANFVDNIRHLVGRALGMHEKEHREGDPLEGKLPKPVRTAAKAIRSAGSAPGHASDEKDQTQKPMEEILWDKVNPKQIEPIIKTAPHVVGELVDNWERFANAISPTAPFSQRSYLRIDAVLMPVFLISLFVNYYMIYKVTGFAIGFGIFGDPILTPSLQWLNRTYPNWMELLEPKNNILRGVPTNSQLTLTLLRIGEANQTPIPPVPTSRPNDPDQKEIVDPDEIPLDASDNEIQQAVQPSGTMEKSYPQHDEDEAQPKHKRMSKIMRVLKGNTKATVETKLAVDHVRAKVGGSEKAKGHLGVLPKKKNLIFAGPSDYKARFDGKKGWMYITDKSVRFSHTQGDGAAPVVEILLRDIKQLKRATAFSVKAAEMAADWGTGDELLGSVEIDDAKDKTWRFTALPERDELFNRLVAIGDQRWENL